MARVTRTKLAEGVWSDKYGLSGIVRVGKAYREERFAHGTSAEFIQAWRSRTRADMLEDREHANAAPPITGTFTEAVERFMERITSRVAFQADCSHARAWLPAFGKLQRSKIRPTQVQIVINDWTRDGVAARTIRHRRRVLRELYLKLDGPNARPPVKGVTLPSVPDPVPVSVPWRMVQKVAKSLSQPIRQRQACGPSRKVVMVEREHPAKGQARFLVLATTGQRPVQVMRAQPEDIDLKRRVWFVRPAKGGNPVALPLDAEMVKAWKLFAEAGAWGTFDTRSFGHLLRRHGWPKGVRPYAVRSTFAIDMILGGADLSDVQSALGHKRIDTTRRHYASVQLARFRKSLKMKRRGKLL